MGISFVRTVILYVLIIFAMRIMGKRTIGEMHPTELVVSIMISDLATVPMQSKETPLFEGIIPIFTLVVLELTFAFLILKSRSIRRVLVGKSCAVVKKGKLLEKNMANLRVTVEDVEEQIRIAGYTSLSEVREVMIETNGQISAFGVDEQTESAEDDLIPFLVIVDGKLRKRELQSAKMKMGDLERLLKARNIDSVKEVLYMSAANSRIVHLQRKGEK